MERSPIDVSGSMSVPVRFDQTVVGVGFRNIASSDLNERESEIKRASCKRSVSSILLPYVSDQHELGPSSTLLNRSTASLGLISFPSCFKDCKRKCMLWNILMVNETTTMRACERRA
jgi:hypothetical protein